MSDLLPVGADVYLKYKCPKCDCEHVLRREETEFPGRILCVCNAKLTVRPIGSINVQPLYREAASKNFVGPKPAKAVDKPANRDIMNETGQALISLGYKKDEAKQMVLRAVKLGTYTTTEELLQAVFKGEKNHGE